MLPTNSKEIMKALSIRLAKRQISSAVLESLANKIVHDGLKIGGIDFCPYGICIDYFADERILVDKFLANKIYRVARLFPYGVLADDLYRLQIELHVPELAEHGVRG